MKFQNWGRKSTVIKRSPKIWQFALYLGFLRSDYKNVEKKLNKWLTVYLAVKLHEILSLPLLILDAKIPNISWRYLHLVTCVWFIFLWFLQIPCLNQKAWNWKLGYNKMKTSCFVPGILSLFWWCWQSPVKITRNTAIPHRH